jgi:hypothetical protein
VGVNHSYRYFDGTFFSQVTVLEFYKGEIKQNIELTIPVVESERENVNFPNCQIELVGET